MKQRIRNLIIKLMNNNELYTNYSPRISKAEIKEIESLVGSFLQTEAVHGAERGSPRAVYPLHIDDFREKSIILLEKE